jgi:hypothetical protein
MSSLSHVNKTHKPLSNKDALSVSAGAVTPAAWWASTRQHLTRAAADLQTASRNWKAPDFSKGLGVKLDIDMLSPAVTTVKQQYAALPEPLREVMPFAGRSCHSAQHICRV